MASRSSSPQTPDILDEPHHVAIHNDLPSWCHTLRPLQAKAIPVTGAWDSEEPQHTLEKPGDERMLELNDLIEEHAYDDSPGSGVEHSPLFSRPPSDANCSETTVPTDSFQPSAQPSPQQSEYHLPSHSHLVCTPIVPPPAIRPRKRDLSVVPRRVICPPRESCYNLVVLTPNIPKSGTKSRVETQIRVTVDLAQAIPSSDEPCQYDRIGSWKWLKLPPGTSTKKRTRREGKIDPTPVDILHLTATVTCASAPYNTVLSCGSCRNREAKRVARKLAARVRPARSDSEGAGNGNEQSKGVKEDTTSIIQFNCPEVLDFSSGSAVLPVRITCYCRHHREKVGFVIHFTMMNHSGYVVGSGATPPIMITDDHKSTMKSGTHPGLSVEAEIWAKAASTGEPTEPSAPSKRSLGKTKTQANKRVKPYDVAARNNSSRFSREPSVASISSSGNSPSTHLSTVSRTRSPTPLQAPQPLSPLSSQAQNQTTTAVEVPTPVDVFAITNEHTGHPVVNMSADVFSSCSRFSAGQSISPTDTISAPVTPAPPTNFFSSLVSPQPMPFMFFGSSSPQSITSLPVPKIHRLIPSSGPTHGGIEVTVLGENFHPAVQLNCVFGDVSASSTQRWSDNTLLCVLPPRATAGVVAVWFEGIDKTREASPLPLFTYTDESDRALMELALQVVGLKMTGKIEDAKNVALRIVSTTGTEDPSPSSNPSSVIQAVSTTHDIQPMLLVHSDDSRKYEASILKLLSLIDLTVPNQADVTMAKAVSYTTKSGQTLLHLAALLNLAALTEFLIIHDVDLDVRDRSGYTALHFAVLARSKTCATLLVTAGADLEIVNVLGKTPQDMAPAGFFDKIIRRSDTLDEYVVSQSSDDGESHWGDVETDDDMAPVIRRRHVPRIVRQYSNRRTHDPDEEPCNAEPSPPPKGTTVSAEEAVEKIPRDEKPTASFVDFIQRTLLQFPPQGIIPNMPELPLPHLPGIPAVPWAALPQIPMVFPVFVPVPGWPSFLSEKREGQPDEDLHSRRGSVAHPIGNIAERTAQELRAAWEKWITTAATLPPPPEEEAPPMYTPRESPEETPTELVISTSEVDSETTSRPPMRPPAIVDCPTRPVGYEVAPVDVDSYGYIPTKSHTNAKQKHDRMLVLFWLPILLLSLLWAFHNGFRFVFYALKTTLSTKAGVHV
ncbi:hypothetical protein V8B97DRAFT_2021472 [Scleroderma yunnanense]